MLDQRAHSVYRRLLIRKGHGYPLWIPEPDTTLPDAYHAKGVGIGDVGLLTDEGGFDYLFNIHSDAKDPVNRNGVPDGFRPLPLPEAIGLNPAMHPAHTYITSEEVRAKAVGVGAKVEPPLVSIGGGLSVEFSTSSAQGAILVLPMGASRYNAKNQGVYVPYISANARAWYEYANVIRGRCAPNGTLYLVTGCDKARAWGTAAFSSQGDKTREVALHFFVGGLAEGHTVLRSSWGNNMGVETRVSSGEGVYENQCIFTRGFSIAYREKAIMRKVFGPVQFSRINGSLDDACPSFDREPPFGSRVKYEEMKLRRKESVLSISSCNSANSPTSPAYSPISSASEFLREDQWQLDLESDHDMDTFPPSTTRSGRSRSSNDGGSDIEHRTHEDHSQEIATWPHSPGPADSVDGESLYGANPSRLSLTLDTSDLSGIEADAEVETTYYSIPSETLDDSSWMTNPASRLTEYILDSCPDADVALVHDDLWMENADEGDDLPSLFTAAVTEEGVGTLTRNEPESVPSGGGVRDVRSSRH